MLTLKMELRIGDNVRIGTFALNIFRVTVILLVDYFYGAEVDGTAHYIVGYALFSAWLAIFPYAFSKRHIFSKTLFK